MGLIRQSGNMYPWVTHMHSHLEGRCPHECSYCYVQAQERRFRTGKYEGHVRFCPDELGVKYGTGKTIFLEHKSDLFSEGVSDEVIALILAHARGWPGNDYVLQTKNPERVLAAVPKFPERVMVGVTIETNREDVIREFSKAPPVCRRVYSMMALRRIYPRVKTFVTIEPVMEMDWPILLAAIRWIMPDFVNIGADSKGGKLPEPREADLWNLLHGLADAGIPVRRKHNLERILGE